MLGFSPLGASPLASVSVINGAVVVVVPVVPVAIGRPSADLSNTGWTPSAGTDLYAMVNEVTQDDTNSISASSLGAVCRMQLPPMIAPGNVLKYAGSSSMGNSILVRLYAGTDIVGTWAHALTLTNDVYVRQLSQVQADLLAAGDLSVSFTVA